MLAEEGAALGRSPAHRELGEVARGLRPPGGSTGHDVRLVRDRPPLIPASLHDSGALSGAVS